MSSAEIVFKGQKIEFTKPSQDEQQIRLLFEIFITNLGLFNALGIDADKDWILNCVSEDWQEKSALQYQGLEANTTDVKTLCGILHTLLQNNKIKNSTTTDSIKEFLTLLDNTVSGIDLVNMKEVAASQEQSLIITNLNQVNERLSRCQNIKRLVGQELAKATKFTLGWNRAPRTWQPRILWDSSSHTYITDTGPTDLVLAETGPAQVAQRELTTNVNATTQQVFLTMPRALYDSSVCPQLTNTAAGGAATTSLTVDLSESFLLRQRTTQGLTTYDSVSFGLLLSQWQTLTSLTYLDLDFSGQYIDQFPLWFSTNSKTLPLKTLRINLVNTHQDSQSLALVMDGIRQAGSTVSGKHSLEYIDISLGRDLLCYVNHFDETQYSSTPDYSQSPTVQTQPLMHACFYQCFSLHLGLKTLKINIVHIDATQEFFMAFLEALTPDDNTQFSSLETMDVQLDFMPSSLLITSTYDGTAMDAFSTGLTDIPLKVFRFKLPNVPSFVSSVWQNLFTVLKTKTLTELSLELFKTLAFASIGVLADVIQHSGPTLKIIKLNGAETILDEAGWTHFCNTISIQNYPLLEEFDFSMPDYGPVAASALDTFYANLKSGTLKKLSIKTNMPQATSLAQEQILATSLQSCSALEDLTVALQILPLGGSSGVRFFTYIGILSLKNLKVVVQGLNSVTDSDMQVWYQSWGQSLDGSIQTFLQTLYMQFDLTFVSPDSTDPFMDQLRSFTGLRNFTYITNSQNGSTMDILMNNVGRSVPNRDTNIIMQGAAKDADTGTESHITQSVNSITTSENQECFAPLLGTTITFTGTLTSSMSVYPMSSVQNVLSFSMDLTSLTTGISNTVSDVSTILLKMGRLRNLSLAFNVTGADMNQAALIARMLTKHTLVSVNLKLINMQVATFTQDVCTQFAKSLAGNIGLDELALTINGSDMNDGALQVLTSVKGMLDGLSKLFLDYSNTQASQATFNDLMNKMQDCYLNKKKTLCQFVADNTPFAADSQAMTAYLARLQLFNAQYAQCPVVFSAAV